MGKMTTVQTRHSEKWLTRVINLKCFSLENHFNGETVADDRAAAVLRREITTMGALMKLYEGKAKGRLRVHSNLWYEFDIKPENAPAAPASNIADFLADKTGTVQLQSAVPGGTHYAAAVAAIAAMDEVRPDAKVFLVTDGEMPTPIEQLMLAWDDMDNAAQRMLMALPSQMTEAAERLDTARRAMRAVVQKFGLFHPMSK